MHSYLPLKRSLQKLFILLSITVLSDYCYGQKTTYNQFWNEIQFTRTLNEKWSAELDLANSFSSTESSSNLFENNVQRSFRFWGNYYLTPRWKTSAFVAYYDNKDVPEIGQFKSPEWRFALQGTYYFHKIGYSLTTRMRLELRHIRDENLEYENVLRYRQQIKYLKPLNSKVLRKGVIYAIASDEIFLKTGTKVTGESFFDRNRFNIGAGYLFNDDIQLELTYANEYLPRNNGDQIVNAASLTLTFNNLYKNVRKKLSHKNDPPVTKEDE
ncbi:DUF2490 domain-containing protein [Flavobacterium sp. Fl-318]|uniref:DUF2490 domain-containing protein n=1 Tax=Flavobacterium cupriresistens TaxID=2893885 RepID=A0ABU4RFK9_9FLAO|nr:MULTISPECIES: DUF2490 domain-containing protein [unclassified Flavobacterium]MDX6190185.1 DUF2490 domain-containing protein [Flavobacterium sp. Fl-318]UFH43003.1 DUF2490 domain-containing protein [Flavobacterium sp. F-323]